MVLSLAVTSDVLCDKLTELLLPAFYRPPLLLLLLLGLGAPTGSPRFARK